MRFKSILLISAFTMIVLCMSGQEMTNDTLHKEAFKEGVFYDIWTFAHSSGVVTRGDNRIVDNEGRVKKDEYYESDEIYVYDYDLVRSLPIEVKKVVALYTSFVSRLFNDEDDKELAQALGDFPTLAAARESLSLPKESNASLRANPYSLNIKKQDNRIYVEWYDRRSGRGIVDEFKIDHQGITYIPETPLEKPYDREYFPERLSDKSYGREYFISQYGDYWTLLNGEHIHPQLTYLDPENIESVKVKDRVVYITQKNKEPTYFSLNDIDLSAFNNVGIDSIKQIKYVSIIDNGKYANDFSFTTHVENSIIDSLTIHKDEKYNFYYLSIWLNSQNRCLSYYDEDINKIVYMQPLIMAEYPGGEQELLRYISENVKPQAQEELQARISLACIIDDDGTVKHVKVKKRTGNDEYKTEEEYTPYDKEFVRMAKTMQRWKPAVCNGKNVPSLVFIPIRFH